MITCDPQFLEETGIVADGPNISQTDETMKLKNQWQEKNQRSAYLTSCYWNECICHHNDQLMKCTVIFEKINDKYRYRCTVCGRTHHVVAAVGRSVLGF